MMDIKRIIKINARFIILMLIVITLGVIGVAYAITVSNLKSIGINTTAAEIGASINFDDATDGKITNTGNLFPIDDSLVTLSLIDTRVLKTSFSVVGLETNPENTIFDIAFRDVDIDCELRTSNLKWRLYRNDTMISSGSFSPTFDAMINNRMVLTETQEDLSSSASHYTLLIWISESCPGNIASCDSSLAQNNYLNKKLNLSIKVELSTKSKKTLERITASEESCGYISTNIPVCNNMVFNGTSQTLVNSGSNYTLINEIGINAGYYSVVARLKDNYKWNDETTEDKIITCKINEKPLLIETSNQTTTYGQEISNAVSNVVTSGLIEGHSLSAITLYSSIINVGSGTISASNAKIIDTNGNDVTGNYNITYNNTGVITINSAS